jgi:hypothetical protein
MSEAPAPPSGQALARREPDPAIDRIARVGQWLAASEAGNAQPTRQQEMAAALRLYYVLELGLKPQAASAISVIKGRLYPHTQMLRAMAKSHGYDVVRVHGDDESCTAAVVKTDTGRVLGEYTFTIEQARRAGLIRDGSAWNTYPDRMLWSKAARYALNDYAPQVALGMGGEDEDELIEAEYEDFQPVPAAAIDQHDEYQATQDQAAHQPWTQKQQAKLATLVRTGDELDQADPARPQRAWGAWARKQAGVGAGELTAAEADRVLDVLEQEIQRVIDEIDQQADA